MSDQKILFVSIVYMLGLNLLVAPMVGEGDSSYTLPDLEPPSYTIFNADFNPSEQVGLDGGGLLSGLASILVDVIGYIIGLIAGVIWFVIILIGVITSGTFSHPLITISNFLTTMVVFYTVIKIFPTT